MTKRDFLRSPLLFNANRIQNEVVSLIEQNQAQDKGGDEWTELVLEENGNPTVDSYLDHSPYLSYLLGLFSCENRTVAVKRMRPGLTESISSHEGESTFYFSVQSTQEPALQLNAQAVYMEPGSCWYLGTGTQLSSKKAAPLFLTVTGRASDQVVAFWEMAHNHSPSLLFALSDTPLQRAPSSLNKVYTLFASKLLGWGN